MCCSVIRFVTQSLYVCSVITCVAQSLDLLPSHYMFCSVIISITQSIIYMWLSDCICHSVIMCHACFHFLMMSSFWSSLSVSGTTVVFRQQDFVGQKNVVGHAFDSFEIYDKLSMKDVTKHMTCNISVFSFVLYTYVCHAHSLHDCFSTFVQHAFLSSASS